MSDLVLKNIGTIFTGDINAPLQEGTSIAVKDGKITEIANDDLSSKYPGAQVIDVNNASVLPGLLDSHVHTVLGDFTPRQSMLSFIESSLHGGVTTMISAGEAHCPGRPKDPAGVKALAILASKSFYNAPPAGVKVHGGAVILEKGLTEQDFIELKEAGVWIVGEVGLGSISSPADAAPMVELAHKHGFVVQMHTGGTSIPGSSTVTAQDVIDINPSVVSHINGGPTAISPAEVDKLIETTDLTLEIVQCGNAKIADHVARVADKNNMLHRIIFGNDAPSGTGVIPLGILRNISQVSSVSDIPAEKVVCMATGNTAKRYGLNTGIIAVGKEADMVIADAPLGSIGEDAKGAIEAGDLLGISAVIINGDVKVKKSRNTPPPKRAHKAL